MRRRWALAGVILSFALAARASANAWDEARQAFEAGRLEEAAALFRAGAERHPDVAQWHYMLGFSLVRLERPAEAIASLARAVELNAGSHQYALLLAQAQVTAGLADAGLGTLGGLEPAAVEESYRATYAQLLAAAAARSSDPAATRPLLERAVTVMPGSPPLWQALGVARQAAADLPGTLAAWTRWSDLEPDNATAARLAVEAGFRAARQIEVRDEKARAYADAGALADRLTALDDSSEARLLAGEAWLGAKQYAHARAWLERVAEADREELRFSFVLGQCLLGEGRIREALATFDRLLEGLDDEQLRRQVQGHRAYALVVLHDYARAAAAYREAGDEEAACAAERAVAAWREEQAHREECTTRLAKFQKALDEMIVLGAKREIENLERKIATIRAECRDYLGDPEG